MSCAFQRILLSSHQDDVRLSWAETKNSHYCIHNMHCYLLSTTVQIKAVDQHVSISVSCAFQRILLCFHQDDHSLKYLALVMETDDVSQESVQTLLKCSSVFWFGSCTVRFLPWRIPHSSESGCFCYLIHPFPHSSKSYQQCLGKIFASTQMVARL